ncbi:MAG: response regulator [Acidobacteriaceae bacterium]|nr:response regulator [Acidobacteriaceae bacterium]
MPLSNAKTVLIVDDSKFFRTATERTLTKAGYSVITATDGEEGLHVAREQMPGLILLDMLLPKLDGPSVLHQLKADSKTRKIPVLVLTSLSQRNEEKLVSEGAAAFLEKERLVKDFQPLLQAISQLLR